MTPWNEKEQMYTGEWFSLSFYQKKKCWSSFGVSKYSEAYFEATQALRYIPSIDSVLIKRMKDMQFISITVIKKSDVQKLYIQLDLFETMGVQ